MSATDPMFDEEDLLHEQNYCKHGTFIGNPYGADYMCGWCEDGVSDQEYEEHLRYNAFRRLRRDFADTTLNVLVRSQPTGENSALVSLLLMHSWFLRWL